MHDYFISELPVLALSDWKRAALFFEAPVVCCWFHHSGIYDASVPGVGPFWGEFRTVASFIEEFDDIVASGLNIKIRLVHTHRAPRYWNDHELALQKAFLYAVERVEGQEAARSYRHFYDQIDRDRRVTGNDYFEKQTDSKCHFDWRYDTFHNWIRAVSEEHGMHDIHGWASTPGYGASRYFYDSPKPATDQPISVDLRLANIGLVDTQAMPWRLIRELRSDGASVDELRSLRRFVVSSMRGFPLSHIEDELSAAIKKHESASRRWSLARGNSELSISVRSSAASGILAALGVAAAGSDLTTALAVGASIPLAQALITASASRQKLLGESRVSYLVRLRSLAER